MLCVMDVICGCYDIHSEVCCCDFLLLCWIGGLIMVRGLAICVEFVVFLGVNYVGIGVLWVWDFIVGFWLIVFTLMLFLYC